VIVYVGRFGDDSLVNEPDVPKTNSHLRHVMCQTRLKRGRRVVKFEGGKGRSVSSEANTAQQEPQHPAFIANESRSQAFFGVRSGSTCRGSYM